MNNSLEDKSEGAVVQQKGRFKVTSADAGSKVFLNTVMDSSFQLAGCQNICQVYFA